MSDADEPCRPDISGVRVRPAADEELPGIMNLLDRALLDIGAERVGERIEAGAALVASDASDHGRPIYGALVLSEAGHNVQSDTGTEIEFEPEIEAIAVRRRYRGSGIGTALVERARRETSGRLVAAFDARVRPFYASLGFRVRPIGDGRFRGRDRER